MLKPFWHKRAFRKHLNKQLATKKLDQAFTVQRVNVILDGHLEIENDFFIHLANAFGIPHVNVSVLLFPNKSEVLREQYQNIYNPEEIGFFGEFSGNLKRFCEHSADIQLNYFNSDNLYLNWIASKTQAKMGIGFLGADKRINDLIFDFDPKEKEVFERELIKYLGVLKKIK